MAKLTVGDIRRILLAKERDKLQAKMALANEKPEHMTEDYLCGIHGISLNLKYLAGGWRKLFCVKCEAIKHAIAKR